jgi:hypothetical protein
MPPLLHNRNIAASLVQLFNSDLNDARRALFSQRKHSSKWFCKTFHITI